MFKKAQGHLSWPVLAGSCAASDRANTWEKPVGSVLELCLIQGELLLWEGCVARQGQQACQRTRAAVAVPADR